VTPDDSWSNRWRAGANASLGWDATLPGSGAGAKSLGQELAASDAFAHCQVTKVFQAVCFRAPISSADQATVAAIKASFKSGAIDSSRCSSCPLPPVRASKGAPQ